MDSRTLGNVSNVAHSCIHRDEVLIVKREKKPGEHQANTDRVKILPLFHPALLDKLHQNLSISLLLRYIE